MFALFGPLFGLIGSVFTGLFGYKQEQAKTVQSALDVLKSVNDVDGQSAAASAQVLTAILTQGSFLEKNWRPFFMLILMTIVVSFFFGYQPSHINDAMSPTMQQIWDLLKIGLCGYMPLRTVEKIMQQINIGSILKTLIQKKLV